MKKLALAILLFAGACAGVPPTAPSSNSSPTPVGPSYMPLLVRFMTGTFETVPQGTTLGVSTPETIRQAPFWKDAKGELWMYAEYVRGGEERPYRQRIYRFTESAGLINAAIFDLPGDPARFVGEWRKEAPFAGFKPADLKERVGCDVTFIPQMEVLFNGGRRGEGCHDEFPDAHHVHAEFYISSSSLRTWEYGRDAAGKQVAGPAGPSEFRKILQFPR
jgi:CpeT protein